MRLGRWRAAVRAGTGRGRSVGACRDGAAGYAATLPAATGAAFERASGPELGWMSASLRGGAPAAERGWPVRRRAGRPAPARRRGAPGASREALRHGVLRLASAVTPTHTGRSACTRPLRAGQSEPCAWLLLLLSSSDAVGAPARAARTSRRSPGARGARPSTSTPGAARARSTTISPGPASELRQRFGVELVHVKLTDTGEAVARVAAEKAAGRTEGGTVDLIWINGENFAADEGAGPAVRPVHAAPAELRPGRHGGPADHAGRLHHPDRGLREPVGHGEVRPVPRHGPRARAAGTRSTRCSPGRRRIPAASPTPPRRTSSARPSSSRCSTPPCPTRSGCSSR